MLLKEVSAEDLRRITAEINGGHRKFTKGMIALAKVENPLYEVWVSIQADCARNLHRQNTLSAQEIHDLVCDIGMSCLRILALAAQNGGSISSNVALGKELMSDPDTSISEPGLDALETTLLLLEQIRTQKPLKPS